MITDSPLESEISTLAITIQDPEKFREPEMRFVVMDFWSSMVERRGMSAFAPIEDELHEEREKGSVAERKTFARLYVHNCGCGWPICEAKRSANLCK